MNNEIKQIISQLTDEEKTVLIDANAKKGEILVVNTFGTDEALIRKKAKTEEALEVLTDRGLMRDKKGKGEVFSLTNLGWEVSDGLKTE